MFTNLRVTKPFPDESEPHVEIMKNFDAVFTKLSKITKKTDGTFDEYPQVNKYPPFWRKMNQIKKDELDLGMLFSANLFIINLNFSHAFEDRLRC